MKIADIKLVNNPRKRKAIQQILDAFEDVRKYEKGKKKLKSAKRLLIEI